MVDQRDEAPGLDHHPHVLAGLEDLQHRLGQGMRRRLEESGLQLRGSEARILDLIEPGGTRPTVLAEGAWISKQAIAKRIQDLERRGLVRVRPDPADGRAVLVHRTGRGDRARDLTLTQIADLEAELRDQVGAERYECFREILHELGRPARKALSP